MAGIKLKYIYKEYRVAVSYTHLDRRGRTLKPEIQARAMERLRASIQKALRSSDVYARYSVSQFILLLSSATFENSEMVMNRIRCV